nr:SPOR domain-containing protein [uncultured Treponema sp.]
MEQKKILWVILSVSLFVLIIFGVALFLYSPSRNSATAQAGGETIPYESSNMTAPHVDPDMWARDPDKVAALDTNAPEASGNIINLNNVNIIATDGQTKGIDVSDLTTQAAEADASGLPKELAEQIGIDTGTEPQQPEASAVKEEAAAQAVQIKSAIQIQQKASVEKKTTVKKPAEKKAASSISAQAQKKASPKAKTAAPQVQTLYWVQAASLANRINAERARDKLAAQHMKVEIFTKETASGLTHRVRVGPFSNSTEAKYWLKNIQKIDGFEAGYITEEKVTKS